IVTNPPIRAGKAVIYALFARARDFLNPGGALYIVIRKQQGAPSALKFLKERYASVEILDREAGFWVLRAGEAGER
ncbi:MAG: methyltransferase, partial [Clostridia bacterium]|nr:methyltransferase [Clostridia bacterium]